MKFSTDLEELLTFRVEAGANTYAGYGAETPSSRPNAHELKYQKGDWLYIDSYFGGPNFCGEEIIYKKQVPLWSMNYCGRVLKDDFSGDFLKEALRHASLEHPFRGPDIYKSGEYIYKSTVSGTPEWFQGFEEIFFYEQKCYECFLHGGVIR